LFLINPTLFFLLRVYLSRWHAAAVPNRMQGEKMTFLPNGLHLKTINYKISLKISNCHVLCAPYNIR
jgi:hypothetical protein